MAITQECCEQYWTSPGGNTSQNGYLPPITKTIQVRRIKHAGHCCKNKDKLISNILLWTLSHRQSKARRSARTYIQQFCGIEYVALKTTRDQWMIETGGERGSGRSLLAARQDYIYIYIYNDKRQRDEWFLWEKSNDNRKNVS